MAYRQIAEVSPWHGGKDECPMNCVGCEHLVDLTFRSKDDIEIECDLKDE